MDGLRLGLALGGMFLLGYVLGGMLEVSKIVSLIHALELSDLPLESKGDLKAMLTAEEE